MPGLKASLQAPTEASAEYVASLLSESPLGEAAAITISEGIGCWRVELYPADNPQPHAFRAVLAAISGLSQEDISVEPLPDEDWVSLTQKGLAPIAAGRFVVHGSHDRDRVGHSRFALEIDAGRAFGTAHHGTTRGCLMAIDALAKHRLPVRAALDLGTGSGILAIAVTRSFRCLVHAVDVDPVAIDVARENCRKNKASDHVTLAVGDGWRPAAAYKPGYDLIVANILAQPLLCLAARVRDLTQIGGRTVLSGLLDCQAREVLGAYRSRGYHLERHIRLDGWSTLTLRRRA